MDRSTSCRGPDIRGLVVATLLVAGCTAPQVVPTTTPSTPLPTSTTSTASATPTTASPTGGIHAADGLGDSLFPLLGNEGYDTIHVDVHIDTTEWFVRGAALDGVATLTIVPTTDLDSFVLDTGGLVVRSVEVGGVAAAFTPGDQMRIDPEAVVPAGQEVDVTVRYVAPVPDLGNLAPGAGGLLTTEDGLFAVGEPEGATAWRPANDHPSDKATYEITIVTPVDVVGVSGGTLVSEERSDIGVSRTYVMDDPVASYLVPFAAGDLELLDHDDGGRAFDLRDWYVAAARPPADVLATQADMVDFFEGILGPYPFGEAGALVVDRTFWGAIETQTLSTFAPNAVQGFVLAHELAHQWVGNSVSLADWSDIWLNEGFATYLEWLWVDHAGERSLEASVDRAVARVEAAGDPFGPGEPPADDLFNRVVYERGGLTLYAVRTEVGEEAMTEILSEWVTRFADGNATTDDFIRLAEEVSGEDLAALVEAWLYGPMPPRP